MSTTQNSCFLPTAHDLYRKIIKKMSFTQDTNRKQIKKQISTKLDKHMSLLQSHKQRQLRFQSNFHNIEKSTQETMNQKRVQFQQKDQKIRDSRGNFLTEKKKKMENSFNQWQNVILENKRRNLNNLQKSDSNIKQWNSKCQDSLSKKRQRLNTISSNLNERSQVSSAKTIKYQAEEYERLLQRSLLNPQKQKRNRSKSKLMFNTNTDSRLSSSSRTSTDMNSSRSKIVEQKRFQDYLQKLVNKQKHIKQVRNKKNEIISKFRQQKQNKQWQIGELHKQNHRRLDSKREDMEVKLDEKFVQDRTDNKHPNKSLSAINSKATVNMIYGHRDKDNVYSKQGKKLNKDATLQPRFQKIIMDQLRSIALVTKNQNHKY